MNPPDFSACALVPHYDHPDTVGGVVAVLRRVVPVIVVDDGSAPPGWRAAQAAAHAPAAESGVHPVLLVRHEVNRGKGRAIVSGLQAAREAGYSHALQVDADAQHDLTPAQRFIDASRERPDALVLGYPQYDASIPRSRYYGRYLTHLWVWINSLSFGVRDSMCGFRVYPVDATLNVVRLAGRRMAERMAFDIEICVRSLWEGVEAINLPVPVRYPRNGTSHFRLYRDNVEISRMHARCFFSMLVRAPRILLRRWRS